MPDNTWALIGPPNKVWPLAGTRVIDANYRGFWDVDEVWDAHRFLCKGPAFPNGIEFRVWDMGHKDEKLRFILRVVEPD